CSQAGGEHERVVGIEPRGRGDGPPNLVQHRSRGETDATILEAHVILEVGVLGQARDLHAFGVIEDTLEELRADLEGTLLLPRRSERAQDVEEPEHGVQVALEPDRGGGRWSASGAVSVRAGGRTPSGSRRARAWRPRCGSEYERHGLAPSTMSARSRSG